MAKDTHPPVPMPVRERRPTGSAKARRRAGRLAAVQGLYQIELAGARVDAVVAEFLRDPLRADDDGEALITADPLLFAAILRGVTARLAETDQLIATALDRRTAERLELLLRGILRAGAFELLAHLDTQARIIINEYVDIAHAFYAGREPGMVNGVLDRIGRTLRPAEMGGTDLGTKVS